MRLKRAATLLFIAAGLCVATLFDRPPPQEIEAFSVRVGQEEKILLLTETPLQIPGRTCAAGILTAGKRPEQFFRQRLGAGTSAFSFITQFLFSGAARLDQFLNSDRLVKSLMTAYGPRLVQFFNPASRFPADLTAACAFESPFFRTLRKAEVLPGKTHAFRFHELNLSQHPNLPPPYSREGTAAIRDHLTVIKYLSRQAETWAYCEGKRCAPDSAKFAIETQREFAGLVQTIKPGDQPVTPTLPARAKELARRCFDQELDPLSRRSFHQLLLKDLALAEEEDTTVPYLVGHCARKMGDRTLARYGDFLEARLKNERAQFVPGEIFFKELTGAAPLPGPFESLNWFSDARLLFARDRHELLSKLAENIPGLEGAASPRAREVAAMILIIKARHDADAVAAEFQRQMLNAPGLAPAEVDWIKEKI